MKQEDKQLLLKDLCARLPYEVKVKQGDRVLKLIGVRPLFKNCIECELSEDTSMVYPLEGIKPYFRPLSSMTEGEKEEYSNTFDVTSLDIEDYDTFGVKAVDWLVEHMFDVRDLIPKGLAIEVTEENNPYKE